MLRITGYILWVLGAVGCGGGECGRSSPASQSSDGPGIPTEAEEQAHAADPASDVQIPEGALREIHSVSSPNNMATAHWWGVVPVQKEYETDIPIPLEYGVRELRFTFADDPRVYTFNPAGKLFHSDWRFNIFSPDGTHTLLLQDRFGPYHVIETKALRSYLQGKTSPVAVVEWQPPSSRSHTPVHSAARWLSSTEFQFVVEGSTPVTLEYRLGEQAPRAQ